MLEVLKTRLEELYNPDTDYNILGSMKLFGFEQPNNSSTPTVIDGYKDLNNEQRLAMSMSLQNEVTFIWGPPGTGKTKTLCSIIEQLIKQKKTVLLTSHTNLAVDEVFKKFAKNPDNKKIIESGIIIRHGTSNKQDPELLDFQVDTIIKKKCKILYEEIEKMDNRNLFLKQCVNKQKKVSHNEDIKTILGFLTEMEEKDARLSILEEKLLHLTTQIDDCEKQNAYWNAKIESIKNPDPLTKFLKVAVTGGIIGKVLENYAIQQATQVISKLKEKNTELKEEMAKLNSEIEAVRNERDNISNKVIKIKEEQALSDEDIKNIGLDKVKEYEEEILSNILKIRSLKNEIDEYKKTSVDDAQVIGCTLTKSYMDRHVYGRRFDVMIVDEASMATLPTIFFTGCIAHRYIISGDFRQLPPIAISNEKQAKKWLGRNIFEQSGVLRQVDAQEEDERLVMLKEQYRMHPDIASLINSRMYGGKLITSEATKNEKDKITSLTKFGNRAAILCDTSSTNPWCTIPPRGSRINYYSAIIAVILAEKALKNGVKNIGIITPYKLQAKLISEMLEELKVSKKIAYASTIHKFQGNERECIIIDLVDGPPNKNVGIMLRGTQNSQAAKLLNVAISRAEGKLIIIANSQYIQNSLTYGDITYDILKDLEENGEIIDSKSVLNSYMEQIDENQKSIIEGSMLKSAILRYKQIFDDFENNNNLNANTFNIQYKNRESYES